MSIISAHEKTPKNWKILPISDVCNIRKTNEINSELYVGLEHIERVTNTLIKKANKNDFSSTTNIFKKGDILYGKLRPNLNKVWLATEDGYCSTDLLPLTPNQKILKEFLLYNVSSSKFVSFAISTSSGTKMPRTNWKDIKNFQILVPPLHEQTKITSRLSNIDSLIQQTHNVIKQTQKLKKGLMQKLLPRSMDHIKPNNRKISEKWSEVPIKEIGDIVTGSTPSSFQKDYYGNEYLWATPVDLGKTKYITNTQSMLSSKGFEKIRKIPKNSILVVCIGSTIGKVGFSTQIMSTNQQINSIICKNDDPEFIYYQLLFNQQRIKNSASLVAIPILNKTSFGVTKILKPNDIKDQQKISSILSIFDDKLENEIRYKSQLENLKKWLLPKLLTGKIRVN